jgi:hypothetical protein
METPCSRLMRAMMVNISSTSFGDSPSDGSSSSINSGCAIRRAADGEHLLLAAGEIAGAAGARRSNRRGK